MTLIKCERMLSYTNSGNALLDPERSINYWQGAYFLKVPHYILNRINNSLPLRNNMVNDVRNNWRRIMEKDII